MPGLSRTAPCRGCGKEIGFIKTNKGKTIPVDPAAVYFIAEDDGRNRYVQITGEVVRGRNPEPWDREPSRIGYISHFATCPAADDFRKRKRIQK